MALTDQALMTLADLKTELGITGSSEDAYLERLINSISAQVASYCNRILHYEAGIVEDVAGYGETHLVVAQSPIISIASITLDGSTVSSDSYSIDNAKAGLIYRQDGWVWTASRLQIVNPKKLPGSEDKDYQVTYTAGYITQHQDDDLALGTRDLPYDLEDAAIRWAATRFRARGRDLSLTTEKIGQAQESYGAGTGTSAAGGSLAASGIPADIASALNSYRRPTWTC